MTKNKVVLVPFPFDDLSSSKVRPAVCLTDPIGQYRHVILAFITSRLPEEPLMTDIMINSESDDFGETGLRVSSTIRLHRMMTATADIILRQLGQLSPHQQKQVKGRLKKLFGL
jgi:mRNA interferase MazF